MQKSLRWYKNWKCSIKETHLTVWLVKADVVNKFFICHTPGHLSCSPRPCKSLPVLPGSGTAWLTGSCWHCCWMCANPPAPASALTCTEPCLPLLRLSYPGRDVTKVTHPGRCSASTDSFLMAPSPVLIPQDQACIVRQQRECHRADF